MAPRQDGHGFHVRVAAGARQSRGAPGRLGGMRARNVVTVEGAVGLTQQGWGWVTAEWLQPAPLLARWAGRPVPKQMDPVGGWAPGCWIVSMVLGCTEDVPEPGCWASTGAARTTKRGCDGSHRGSMPSVSASGAGWMGQHCSDKVVGAAGVAKAAGGWVWRRGWHRGEGVAASVARTGVAGPAGWCGNV